MTTPPGFASVTPYIFVNDAAAFLTFLVEGLGGTEIDRTLTLRSPWRYTIAPALEIAEGGACSPTSVNLVRDDIVVMTLRSPGTDCRFIRVIPAPPQRNGPASR